MLKIVAVLLASLALHACGPDPPVDSIAVTVTNNDDRAPVFAWDGGAVGALAVYQCDAEQCPAGAYRDPLVDGPLWHVTGESYTECTFAELDELATYGIVPAIASGVATEAAPAQPLVAGAAHVVVVWRYAGCLGGGPLAAGRATFTAP